mmetsp:Transcript_25179/g.29017  ORF Transcript_25179/g.29017 Transcript_25179/m.29017 type:complete len:149 (-) Transcript_25179:308-754(-)
MDEVSNVNLDKSIDTDWNLLSVLQAIAVFILAGFAEIIGGWLIWTAVRGRDANNNDGDGIRTKQEIIKRPWLFAFIGSIVLVAYGFIPCLQPSNSFGRVYAVYGGFFIVLSFILGWFLDGDKPDLGDIVGGCVAMIGVLLVMFWPRSS